jgi:MFS family permease
MPTTDAPRVERARTRRLVSEVSSTFRPADPVARALTAASLSLTVANGMFYAVSALLFTRAMGIPAVTVGIGLTVSGAVGVLTSLGAGYLADRVGALRLLTLCVVAQGLSLASFSVVDGVPAFVAVACLATGARQAGASARSALVARSFTGPSRVEMRARLHVVVNVGIGLGTCVAAAALLVDTPAAYRIAVFAVGCVTTTGALPLVRLARSTEAARRLAEPAASAARKTAGPETAAQGATAGSEGPTVSGPDEAAPAAGPGRSPFRDPQYLVVVGLTSVFAVHFGLQTVGLPLWIASHTEVPSVMISVLLVLNTVLVALFQVRFARGATTVPSAARTMTRACVVLAVACGLYAAAAVGNVALAVTVLVVAALVHAAAELWGEAGSWTLSFDLADERTAGAYQGLSTMGYAVATMVAPLLVTTTVISHGPAGWAMLAGLFVLVGLAFALGARRWAPHPADHG